MENAGDTRADLEEAAPLNHGIEEIEETGIQKDGDDSRLWHLNLAVAFWHSAM